MRLLACLLAAQLEFMCVVRTERLYLVAVRLQKFPDADPVASRHLEPHRHDDFRQPAAGMLIRLHRVNLAVVSVDIPTVQKPLISHSEGNCRVSASVSSERDHDDLSLSHPYRRCAVHPEPLIALKPVGLPLWVMQPVLRPVSIPLHHCSRMQTGFQFSGKDVYRRGREIRQSASMIQVHVRQKDVFHICRVVAQCLDLSEGCLVQITRATDKVHELAHCGRRVVVITHSPTAIDQRKSVPCVDEQTV